MSTFEDLLKLKKSLELSGIERRITNIEGKQIWTLKSVRSINGVGPDDLGNVNTPDIDIVNWGQITGTITDQTDLISYLTGNYLSLTAQASDSAKLGGHLPAYYQTALGYTAMNVDFSNMGTVPTWNQNTTGNASTATVIATARTINGVSFNGSADITVPAAAGTLTGTTLAAGVTGSSLTSVGTITAGVWQGTAINHAYLTGIVQADVAGLTTVSKPTFAGLSIGSTFTNAASNQIVISPVLNVTTTGAYSFMGMQVYPKTTIGAGLQNTYANVSIQSFDFRSISSGAGDGGYLVSMYAYDASYGHHNLDAYVNPETGTTIGFHAQMDYLRGLIDSNYGAFISTPLTIATPAAWAATTAYTLKTVVKPNTPNGRYYVCSVAGTSGATEPTWPGTSIASQTPATQTDGTVTWTELVIPSITNNYGIYLQNQAVGSSHSYGMYFSGIGISNGLNWGTGTANMYAYSSTTVRTDGFLSVGGRLGIGTQTPGQLLNIIGSATNTVSLAQFGVGNSGGFDATITSGYPVGFSIEPYFDITGNTTAMYGAYMWTGAQVETGITLATLAGMYVDTPKKTGTGTITNAYGLYVNMPTIGANNTCAYFNGAVVAHTSLQTTSLKIVTGTNASAGTGTLTAGTVTISTTAVTSTSLIILTSTATSTTNVGTLTVSAQTAGSSFVVTSTNALDTSTFNWLIIN